MHDAIVLLGAVRDYFQAAPEKMNEGIREFDTAAQLSPLRLGFALPFWQDWNNIDWFLLPTRRPQIDCL